MHSNPNLIETPWRSSARRLARLAARWREPHIFLPLVTLVLHGALAHRFGLHRDELYFLVSGRALAWGYVDQPPLVPALAALMEWLFGTHAWAVRIPSVLARAGTVYATIGLTRSLGGDRRAAWMSGLFVLSAPAFLSAGSLLHLPTFEPLYWTVATWLLVEVLRTGRTSLWIVIGLVAGLGLLNKHTLLVWGAGAALVMLLVPAARARWSRWTWLGASLAFALVLPNLVWQQAHGWPTVEFIRTLSAEKHPGARVEFVLGQLLYAGPLAVPVAWAGIVWAVRRSRRGAQDGTEAKTESPVAADPEILLVPVVIFVTAFIAFWVGRGKPYYVMAAYPGAFALGGIWWSHTRSTTTGGPLFRMRQAYLGLAITLAPGLGVLALPILPVPTGNAAMRLLLGRVIPNAEDLNGEFQDQLGWRQQASTVRQLYAGIDPAERAATAIVTGNYGQASAIRIYAGLPAVSGHMNYALWDPPASNVRTVLAVGFPPKLLAPYCTSVTEKARIVNEHARAPERNVAVHLCQLHPDGRRALWPALRRFGFARAPLSAPAAGAGATGAAGAAANVSAGARTGGIR